MIDLNENDGDDIPEEELGEICPLPCHNNDNPDGKADKAYEMVKVQHHDQHEDDDTLTDLSVTMARSVS